MWTAFALATAVFTVALVMGLGAPPEVVGPLAEEVVRVLEPLAGRGPLTLFAFIFLNNAIKALFVVLLGVALGVIPLLFVAVNGYILGAMTAWAVAEAGVAMTIAGLAPHGVVEVPAVLLASAIGVLVGREVVLTILGRGGQVSPRLRQGIRCFLFWVSPAMLAAAFIEAFITPVVVGAISGKGPGI